MIRKFIKAYLQSTLFLCWSVLCISFGAAWMWLAIMGVLQARGLL